MSQAVQPSCFEQDSPALTKTVVYIYMEDNCLCIYCILYAGVLLWNGRKAGQTDVLTSL